MQSISRRQFLGSDTSVVAIGALGAEKKEKALLPIVDTHQHLWDLEKFNLPWMKDVKPLSRSFLLSDYVEATKGLNVVKTVYMEVDVVPEQQVAEAEFVLGLCKRPDTKMAGAVISGRLDSEEFAAYLRRFK